MRLIEKFLDYVYQDEENGPFVTFGLIGVVVLTIMMSSLTIWKKLDNDFELAKITAGKVDETKKTTNK